MILEGNTRGYGQELARHLLNARDNEHVRVHGLRGFASEDLFEAFGEAEAISKATQCQKYLFSLSLNPPQDAEASIEDFEAAVEAAETRLGLSGQPRAIVFHEKNGRRHAHAVWSRIDGQEMKAINLPHFKRKLTDLSQTLYREHGWKMPEGFADKSKRDPDRFTNAEAGQAKRSRQDAVALKRMFRTCWETSDSRMAFEAALSDPGFALARGDRRGFVAVDANGKVWSLSRWCGVKPKELRARIGDEATLPRADDVRGQTTDQSKARRVKTDAVVEARRSKLVEAQRKERADLLKRQESRRISELREQQAQRRKGLRAAFAKLTGQYQKHIAAAEVARQDALQRDRQEQDALIRQHLQARRDLVRPAPDKRLRHDHTRALGLDPAQRLETPNEQGKLCAAQLRKTPFLACEELSKNKTQFTRTDVLRILADRITDPTVLTSLADRALSSAGIVKLQTAERRVPAYTTTDYRDAEATLHQSAQRLAVTKHTKPDKRHIDLAISTQNKAMNRAFGGSLSQEQRAAIRHVVSGDGLSCVVGLAGAGKSTMLATAREALERQGITVHGAALAGKAADGLEESSGITSRTLAALEMSWDHGNAPIKRGDVLVVDEAGMVGTRQMARLTSKMQEIGSKLVLVGDPDQLQPIEAGTPFRDVLDQHKAAHLTEIHRQKADWQKAASKSLAIGDTGTALSSYQKAGCVESSATSPDAIEALVERYAMDALANPHANRLAFAHRRKDVHALNQAIRAAMRAPDTAQTDTLYRTATGKRAFASGDRLVFGKNDKDLGVKNGMLGTVLKATDGTLSVQIDGDVKRTVTLDPKHYTDFDHGYAVTIHKSQGATVDQAYVLASKSMDKHLAYVAMTRHKAQLEVFVAHDDAPRWSRPQRAYDPVRQADRPRAGPSRG